MKTNSKQNNKRLKKRQEKRQTPDSSLYDNCNVSPQKAQSLLTEPTFTAIMTVCYNTDKIEYSKICN